VAVLGLVVEVVGTLRVESVRLVGAKEDVLRVDVDGVVVVAALEMVVLRVLVDLTVVDEERLLLVDRTTRAVVEGTNLQ
jgi:hypothetical protein